jgi:hypothetical protein
MRAGISTKVVLHLMSIACCPRCAHFFAELHEYAKWLGIDVVTQKVSSILLAWMLVSLKWMRWCQ